MKREIMRAAVHAGVNVRASDWGYAFIALGIDSPCTSAAKWSRRVIDLATDLKSVRAPLARPVR